MNTYDDRNLTKAIVASVNPVTVENPAQFRELGYVLRVWAHKFATMNAPGAHSTSVVLAQRGYALRQIAGYVEDFFPAGLGVSDYTVNIHPLVATPQGFNPDDETRDLR